MTDDLEPIIIVYTAPGKDSAALADILVIRNEFRPPAEVCADVFAQCPGLTLAILTDMSTDITVGVRDGSLLTLRSEPPAAVSATAVQVAGVKLYAFWAERRPTRLLSGLLLACDAETGSRLRVQIGRWRVPDVRTRPVSVPPQLVDSAAQPDGP